MSYKKLSENWGKCDKCKCIVAVPTWRFCEFCDTPYQKAFKNRIRRERQKLRSSIRVNRVLAKMKKEGISFRKACSRLRLKLCYDQLLTFKNKNKTAVI